jgi:uncharacterized protein (TIGR03663 family)
MIAEGYFPGSRTLSRWLAISRVDSAVIPFALVTAAAFVARVWDVGARAMHHDESLHATYAWYLAHGQGYQYNPVMHGPLQFYAIALSYLIFGDSETTARLFAVLCGTALVLLPYFIRRELGYRSAVLCSVMLAVSPAFLYYSRFVRDDIYLAMFTMAIVVCALIFLRTQRERWILLLSAMAACAMATMEAAYIAFFVLGSYVVLLCLYEQLALPAHLRVAQRRLRSVGTRSWLAALAIFIAITLLLYSTFFTNPSGILDIHHSLTSPDRTDILGGFTYWLSQHGVARGGQPWFYYLLLLPLYDQFALVFGLGGLIWAVQRTTVRIRRASPGRGDGWRPVAGNHQLVTFLAYWTILSWVVYSWAGEKMPWLVLHPLLPTILLAGCFAGYLLDALSGVSKRLLICVLIVLFVAEAHSAQALSYADGANPTEMLIYVQTSNDVPHVANTVMGMISKAKRAGYQPPYIEVDSNDLGGWPFPWYFRNLPADDVQYVTSFQGATAPFLIMLEPEKDEYVSSLRPSYAVSQYIWNWWFPEDYKGLTFDDGRCGTAGHEVPCSAGQPGMVFLKTGVPCALDATDTSDCSPVQTPRAINIFSAVRASSTWRNLWDWYVFRKPFGARGSRQLFLFVRKNIVPPA